MASLIDKLTEKRAQHGSTLKLKEGIALSDVVDGKGAEFEVADEFEDLGDEDVQEDQAFSREEVFKNLSYICNDTGSDDESDDRTPFQRQETKMEKITEDGGVLKLLLRPGTGNVVPSSSLVRVHYNAYLEFSDEPFDSTWLRDRVEKFRLGEVKPSGEYSGEAIAGVSVAVSSMKKNEFSRFIIKPEYGYGERGCSPRIPPNAVLLYEIELLTFVEHLGVNEFFFLTMEERRAISWQKIKQTCDAGRKEGNILFGEASYHKAKVKYRKAIDILEDFHLKNEEQEREQQKLLLKLYLNISLCFLKLGKYPPTVTFCKKALEIDPNSVKALYRLGQALRKNGSFDTAKDYLKRAQRLDPRSGEINQELGRLASDVESFNFIESKMCKRMFSKPSSQPGDTSSQSENKENTKATLEDFKAVVRTKLTEMKENPEVDDMPFPNGCLGQEEIYCILEAADELGLDVVQRGQAPNIQMLVTKKK